MDEMSKNVKNLTRLISKLLSDTFFKYFDCSVTLPPVTPSSIRVLMKEFNNNYLKKSVAGEAFEVVRAFRTDDDTKVENLLDKKHGCGANNYWH